MAWFLNTYQCERCDETWTDEWSCTCDDECPHCGFRDLAPLDSEDLTEVILEDGGIFIVLRSSDEAEGDPDYEELGRFSTRDAARRYLSSYSPE